MNADLRIENAVVERTAALERLQRPEGFDLLIIGGGATGCGIAVDAASRGLSVALIEKNDLAEGTSSRSTKLVHGGVRYLEKAVKHLDKAQYDLVREGLHERWAFLRNAPHLANRVPLVTPIYRWFDVPYVFSGLLLYDLLAGRRGIGHSRLIGRAEALRRFPMLRHEGLKAGVLYYDGQFNDARMAVTLALTARRHGAVAANHLAAVGLLKQEGRLCGARVRDALSGKEFEVRARGVINATGPFGDSIRRLDDADCRALLNASSGIHIVLSERFVPPGTGLMIPETEDGRVLFILPWQGQALIGTTENPAEIEDHPQAREEEIEYLLRHITRYFDIRVTRQDVKAVWSGLRPLLIAPEKANTAELVREHAMEISASGLLTVAGGKWTSYRKMAEEAVDRAIERFALKPDSGCRTGDLPLVGGERFEALGWQALVERFGLPEDVARHLNQFYGDQAPAVAERAGAFAVRLHPDYPYLEAEVLYVVAHEMAQRASDVLTRRLPLALIDNAAARAALPRVVELMAGELGWDAGRTAEELTLASARLSAGV